jgi:hypothetical protein
MVVELQRLFFLPLVVADSASSFYDTKINRDFINADISRFLTGLIVDNIKRVLL